MRRTPSLGAGVRFGQAKRREKSRETRIVPERVERRVKQPLLGQGGQRGVGVERGQCVFLATEQGEQHGDIAYFRINTWHEDRGLLAHARRSQRLDSGEYVGPFLLGDG